jgi:hypothetical protein
MSSSESSPFYPTKYRYAEHQETAMLPVSFRNWHRIRDRVSALGNRTVDYTNYASMAYGIGITSLVTWVGYVASDSRPAWALPVWGLATVGAFIGGRLCAKFQADEHKVRHENADDITDEMNVIEEQWRDADQP